MADDEQVNIPEEAVEDLEPGDAESQDVAGGGFKRGWPSKFQGPTINSQSEPPTTP